MNGVRIFAVLLAILMAPLMPRIASASDAEIRQGRYMILTGHCNNCHTAGYAAKEGRVPEDQWLLGNPVGWRSKEGTVFAPNLRIYVQTMPLASWLKVLTRLARSCRRFAKRH